LNHNLVYPERAHTKKIQGQVQISFMVDTDGNVVDPFIQKSVEYSVDQESIRVIKNSGKWIPSMLDGVNKNSCKVIPVNYQLPD
jgi:TonB family protein